MSKSYLDKAGVGTLSSLMKKAVKDTVESTKEQLFVVTVTLNEEPPTEDENSITYHGTPSVTFEEAVAQAKSGKKVIIGPDGVDDLDRYTQMYYESSPNLLLSEYEFNLSYDKNIKTFYPFIFRHFQWSSGGLIMIESKTLPKWIGDTKPTYTASEVGAAEQAAVDAKANKPKRVSVTLKASGWDSSAQTQIVTVNGVLADESAQVIQPIPALASQSAYNAAGILATGQAANIIIFTASTVPTADLSVYIVITEVTA